MPQQHVFPDSVRHWLRAFRRYEGNAAGNLGMGPSKKHVGGALKDVYRAGRRLCRASPWAAWRWRSTRPTSMRSTTVRGGFGLVLTCTFSLTGFARRVASEVIVQLRSLFVDVVYDLSCLFI